MVILGINTTSDISKLLYVIPPAVRRVKFVTILKYHEWCLCKISRTQIMLLFVYTTTRKRFVVFTCRYFKLSWNTTALTQSNCRNFSCGSIIIVKTILGSLTLNMENATEKFREGRPNFREDIKLFIGLPKQPLLELSSPVLDLVVIKYLVKICIFFVRTPVYFVVDFLISLDL